MPRGFVCGWQEAVKERKKGRAIGGMVMGIRKDIVGTGLTIEKNEEGIMVGSVSIGEERWKVIGVYMGRRGIEETLKAMEGDRGGRRKGQDNYRRGF